MAAVPYYHYSYYNPPADEVRTLFIAGLPDDVKQREIYNLFREFPGYQSTQLCNNSSKVYGFAVFADQQSAVVAMHALNGMVFDLERESTLHIDLAKSNSRPKRARGDDGLPYLSDKKVRGSTSTHSRSFPDTGAGSNLYVPGMGNSDHSFSRCPFTQSSKFGYESVDEATQNNLGILSSVFVPQNNPPCPTLFVANLGPTCSEHELTQVFQRCPGFLKLKMQKKRGVPVAFVDFQDAGSSSGAIDALQGTILRSSVGEGMRLEYAKSRMGLQKREKKR